MAIRILGRTLRLRKPQWLFAVMFAYAASRGRFLVIFFNSYGLSEEQIGQLFMLRSGCQMLMALLWCRIADKHDNHRLLLTALAVPSTLFFCCYEFGNYVGDAQKFPLFLGVTALTSASFPAFALVDSAVLRMIPDKAKWGSQRVWGAYSWVIVNVSR
jgi:Na+/melibiose symporter-like transporter